MNVFLGLLPPLLLTISLFIYRFNGKKEILRMDLIQFLYAFVLTPVIFVWLKFLIFYNLKDSIGQEINAETMFLIDTTLTIVFIYIFAFMVIHSLTKTFSLKRGIDPLYDIFTHSEYFHGSISHFFTFSGSLLLLFFLGALNIFLPVNILSTKVSFITGIVVGVVLGAIYLLALARYRPSKKFNRVMSLEIIIYTLCLLYLYISFKPKFIVENTIYWTSVSGFLSIICISQFIKNSDKIRHKISLRKKLNIVNE